MREIVHNLICINTMSTKFEIFHLKMGFMQNIILNSYSRKVWGIPGYTLKQSQKALTNGSLIHVFGLQTCIIYSGTVVQL